MSGLDPFSPLDLAQPDPDEPLGAVRPPAIRYIELAQRIVDSPFEVSQLLYFFQHIDLSGKASPTQDSVLAFARTLCNDLLRVDREHLVQDDPSGEIARTKMALVYDGEATDTFFGLLNNTSPFSIAYNHGQDLGNDILEVTDRIAYDNFQKQLSFQGVMTAAELAALGGAASPTDSFRTAIQALYDKGQEAFTAFFDRYPELKALYENFVNSNAPLEDKMSALLADFLPGLRARLKQQQVRQTVSAQLDADLTLVTPLLENALLLHAVDTSVDPAIADFLALETQGLSADIFFADDLTGDADQTDIPVDTIDYRESGATLPPNPAGNAPISGVWHGFLEALDNGSYNFYIEADAGAEISLALDGEAVQLALNGSLWQNQDPVELEAGRLYELAFTAKKVEDLLVLKWERQGMGRAPIPTAQLYPASVLEGFAPTYLRLLKGLAIAEALELSSAELEHFATHDDYSINGAGWLNALPAAQSSADTTTQELLRNVLALLQYRALKEELKIPDGRLLELLRNPSAPGQDGEPLLNRVTGWQEADLDNLLAHFGSTTADLARLENFGRLHNAFTMVKKLGIGATALLDITTNEPAAAGLRTLQGALRARYDDTPGAEAGPLTGDAMPAKGGWPTDSDWLELIQPINDELRSLQRDALVAYVLHLLRQDNTTEHIDTPDKFFEYFLIDVQMDPCMKTSRIKQAISSGQLFIQRCLMNLEPQVASSSIKAGRWEWMKRYRVWEANRKVFLWPENWLEPELRDDKSPFFKDLESELLQSDITDDAAATALVHYLEKLDEVAKLEICGMYYGENELNNEADDVVHVIARTPGARRTYYYRRQEGGTSWTPWEKTDLNIEDKPVLPVVWKGRFFLFWVSVLQEAPEPVSPDGNDDSLDLTAISPDGNDDSLDLTAIQPSQLKGVAGEAETQVTVTLYWSEYYHGKWQPARTSDVNKPAALGEFPPHGTGAFDRANLALNSWLGSSDGLVDNELFIEVEYPDEEGQYFKLYTTHSLPIQLDELTTSGSITEPQNWRLFSIGDGPLTVTPYPIRHDSSTTHTILERTVLSETLQPRHVVARVFEAPFFFQDRQHVFFVKSSVSRVKASEHDDFGIWQPRSGVPAKETVLVSLDPSPSLEAGPPPLDSIKANLVDPAQLESIFRQGRYIHRVINTARTIPHGNRLIGPSGSTAFEEISGEPRTGAVPSKAHLEE